MAYQQKNTKFIKHFQQNHLRTYSNGIATLEKVLFHLFFIPESINCHTAAYSGPSQHTCTGFCKYSGHCSQDLVTTKRCTIDRCPADIPEPSSPLTMINELFYNALWDANQSIQEIMRTQESTSHNIISGFLVSPL